MFPAWLTQLVWTPNWLENLARGDEHGTPTTANAPLKFGILALQTTYALPYVVLVEMCLVFKFFVGLCTIGIYFIL
jgi:hypothetical protein